LTLLALVAGAGLVGGVLNASYDPHENRAPEARIVIAAIATAVGLAAVAVVVKRLRGAEGRGGLLAGLLLTAATVVLIALLVIVDLASGPL
jgi:drug/metabolite transporter (DMT)-like permease